MTERNGDEPAERDDKQPSKGDIIAGWSILAVLATLVIGGLTWGGICLWGGGDDDEFQVQSAPTEQQPQPGPTEHQVQPTPTERQVQPTPTQDILATMTSISRSRVEQQTQPAPTQDILATMTSISRSRVEQKGQLTPTSTRNVRMGNLSYCRELNAHIDELDPLLPRIAQQFFLMSDNPLLMFDDEWKLTTAIYLGSLDFVANELLAMEYPSEARDLHSEIRAAAVFMNAFVEHAANGVDNFDDEEFALAIDAMSQMTERLDRAAPLMAKVCIQ